jgi:uncharacterized protein YegP (UPF0339 family)
MKKIIISLVMVFTVAASAFAGDEKIDERVSKAFQKEFSAAQNAIWSVNKNFYQVTFSYYDRTISAFYDKKGYLLGVSRYMLSTELPYYLQKELKEYYTDYWVTNLFELSNENGTSYHVTLKNAEETIVLSSSEQNSWELYNQYKTR